MNKLKTKLRPAGIAIASVFVGMAISAPALAIQSAPTLTVVGRAPVVTGAATGDITIADSDTNGIINAGDILTVDDKTLTFADPDGDTSSGYDYTWKVGGVAVAGTTSKTYTIKAADLGKKITLSVVAKTDPSKTDPAVSAEFTATFVANTALKVAGKATEITVAQATDVSAAVIAGFNPAGKPVVGTKLTVNVTMADGNPPAAGKVEYQWKVESAPGTYTDVAGAAGTAAEYTPAATDQKKRIVVEVTKK